MSFDTYDKIYCENILFFEIDNYLMNMGRGSLSDDERDEIRAFIAKILEHLRKEEIENELFSLPACFHAGFFFLSPFSILFHSSSIRMHDA